MARSVGGEQHNKGQKSHFHQRLKSLIGNETQSSFAARAGISQSAFNRILHGGDPSLDSLIGIAKAAGVTVGWLAAGEDAPAPAPVTHELGIQMLAFRASAGDGGVLVVDDDARVSPFSRDVLDRLHTRPEHARLLYAAGDSMRPTIEDGDPVLVDISDTDVIDGRIYVFTIGDHVLLKRLRRRGRKLLMRADNRELYPDEEEVPTVEPVRIIGRVRWVGRSL